MAAELIQSLVPSFPRSLHAISSFTGARSLGRPGRLIRCLRSLAAKAWARASDRGGSLQNFPNAHHPD
ncbi:hypothetical protein VTN02DRAFT_926 [Thermoascus thermophilus]